MKNIKAMLMGINEFNARGKKYTVANVYFVIGSSAFVRRLFLEEEQAKKYANYLMKDITELCELSYNNKTQVIDFKLANI